MTNVNNALTNHLDTVEPMHIDPVQGLPDGYLNQIINYNPDVLTCLANLSNDEVFTPPALVNQMLDMLPADLWTNKDAKFLDPVTKSGVFLREIAKRLIAGLATQIPDLQTRINHVMTQQLYGIGITELTSLLARRSLYCAKDASSPLSICTAFEEGNAQGNIRFERVEHNWANGKCFFCGASQAEYDRDETLETHAYAFIHTNEPENIFGAEMKFDVIIGNPPYQLSDGGNGSSASPIYNRFIEQAKKLTPKFLVMIIPARWYAGGKGLDDFRSSMLNDQAIKELVDYPDAKECFPNNSIGGGVCYFLREQDYIGKCNVTNILKGRSESLPRALNQFDVFVRYNKAISILEKVKILSKNTGFLSQIVSSRNPFGYSSNHRGNSTRSNNSLKLITSQGEFTVDITTVAKGQHLINSYKILISKATAEHAGEPDKEGKFKVLSRTEILEPKTVCTDSYLCIGDFTNLRETEHLLSYLCTKFLRFLLLQAVSSINLSSDKFQFIPMQDFNEPWTDEKLYTKYGLTADEIAFIESMIRPMDLGGASDE